MAYADYILCERCDCKLIYDGEGTVRDEIEARFGERKIEFLCPDCRDKQLGVAELIQLIKDSRANYERQFGKDVVSEGIYNELEELFSEALAEWEGKQ